MRLKMMFSRQVHLEVRRNPSFSEFAMESYSRFLKQDWGVVPDEDKEKNEKAVIMGGDILGVYEMEGYSTKTILIVIPEHRRFLEILFKRELNKKKKDRQDLVLYGADGMSIPN